MGIYGLIQQRDPGGPEGLLSGLAGPCSERQGICASGSLRWPWVSISDFKAVCPWARHLTSLSPHLLSLTAPLISCDGFFFPPFFKKAYLL